MEQSIAIKVENISKTFKIPHEKINTMRGAFVNMFNKKTYEEFKALEDISFEIKKGEFLGIIGRNGSGKSTLLKILAGIYKADGGSVKINGMISPFLELGIGFHPELSGRDNIYLNATVLGLTRKQIDEKFDDIVQFSELRNFIDQKLKNYSSGMKVRLAFSVAIHANRDILLMDEVLAVGDTNFQQKCIEEFNRYRELGKTIILVTHSIETVKKYCDNAILLRNGRIELIGDSEKVSDEYTYQNMSDEEKRIVDKEKMIVDKEKRNTKNKKKEHLEKNKKKANTRKVGKITNIELLNKEGEMRNTFSTNESVIIKVYFKASEEVKELNIGISIQNGEGVYLFGYNTQMDEFFIDKEKGLTVLLLDRIPFLQGSYFISVSCFGKGAEERYDFKPRFKNFKIFSFNKEAKYKGLININHKWE